MWFSLSVSLCVPFCKLQAAFHHVFGSKFKWEHFRLKVLFPCVLWTVSLSNRMESQAHACSSSVTSHVHRADIRSWSAAWAWELLDPSEAAPCNLPLSDCWWWVYRITLRPCVRRPLPQSWWRDCTWEQLAITHHSLAGSSWKLLGFVLLFWSSFWHTVGHVPLGLCFLDESVPTAEHRSLSTCSALPQSSLHHSSSVSKGRFLQP